MLALSVNSTLPSIDSNFDELKNSLIAELKQYDLIVDVDSIKVAKKMAIEINKLKGKIDTVRKEKVTQLSAPIKEFDLQAKTLTALCAESRQKILSQVKVFEDEQIDRAKELLKTELESAYDKYGVEDEFKVVQVNDLAILSNLTKTNLAKKAKVAIDERVLETKQFQEKIIKRLDTLEAICFKGGLQAPLTRQNIEHFLKDGDDDVYLEKLVNLIQNEVTRINLMNERIKEQKTTKAVVKEVPLVQAQTQQINSSSLEESKTSPYSHFKNVQEFTPRSKKRTYTVTATFEVEVDESKGAKLEQMLLKKFKDSGFKQIPAITVREVQNVA